MQQLIILGTGGNCIDILDTVNEINARTPTFECIGFLDDNESTWGTECHGIEVLGNLESAQNYPKAYFVNGIGSPFNFWKKEAIIRKTGLSIDRFATIVHPSAQVSQMSSLGRGTVILQNVVVASNVRIGHHVIILPNSVISHDDVIGDYTAITGGVCISGGVTVGKLCYIGTNSAVIGNTTIGERSLVGMGSNVLSAVPANSVVAGNPARFIRHTISEA
ncbi:MAG: acetyltransferase [Salibacteraceae bacterium]